VRFWRVDNPNAFVTTQTDADGNYHVELSNGQWQGEACGSGDGFSPSAWAVTLNNNKLVKMQEIALPAATINQSNDSLAENQELIIDGSGFGCNGSLVFEFHNSVDNFGRNQEVVYNHQPITTHDFCSQTNQQIRLPMPSLMDAEYGNHSDSSRIAKMYFLKNGQRSNAIFVSEFNHLPIDPDHEGIGDLVNNSDSVQDFTGTLTGIPLGDFSGGQTVLGGAFGGRIGGGFAGTPLGQGLGSNQTGVPSSLSASPLSGVATGTFNAEQISIENLNFDASSINFGGL